jgi:hypothetical protein
MSISGVHVEGKQEAKVEGVSIGGRLDTPGMVTYAATVR